MSWSVSAPAILFLAAAAASIHHATPGPPAARTRALVGAGLLLLSAVAMIVLDLTT